MKKIQLMVVLILCLLIPLNSYCPPMKMDFTEHVVKLHETLKNLNEIFYIAYTIRELEGGHKYFKEGKPLKGASGEGGAYQFMPSTWKRLCMKFFNTHLKQTKDNQDVVAYRYIGSLLDKGYTIRQIAAVWNSGNPNSTAEGINKFGVPYSVPKYVKTFMSIYHKVKNQVIPGNLEPKIVANGNRVYYIYIINAKIINLKPDSHEYKQTLYSYQERESIGLRWNYPRSAFYSKEIPGKVLPILHSWWRFGSRETYGNAYRNNAIIRISGCPRGNIQFVSFKRNLRNNPKNSFGKSFYS